ncbi:hypothetical protein COBT_000295 [Conglomerata obtusa]
MSINKSQAYAVALISGICLLVMFGFAMLFKQRDTKQNGFEAADSNKHVENVANQNVKTVNEVFYEKNVDTLAVKSDDLNRKKSIDNRNNSENIISDVRIDKYMKTNKQLELIEMFIKNDISKDLSVFKKQLVDYILRIENKEPGLFLDFKKYFNNRFNKQKLEFNDLNSFKNELNSLVKEMKGNNSNPINAASIQQINKCDHKKEKIYSNKEEFDMNTANRKLSDVGIVIKPNINLTENDCTCQPKILTSLKDYIILKSVNNHQKNCALHEYINMQQILNTKNDIKTNTQIIPINNGINTIVRKVDKDGINGIKSTNSLGKTNYTISKTDTMLQTGDIKKIEIHLQNEKDLKVWLNDHEDKLKPSLFGKIFGNNDHNKTNNKEHLEKNEESKKLEQTGIQDKKDDSNEKDKLYTCICTNKEEIHKLNPFKSCGLDKFYSLSNSKKKYITIDIRPDYYNEITLGTCENNLELVELALVQLLSNIRCEYKELYAVHLQHIADNIYNFYFLDNKTETYKRKDLLYVHDIPSKNISRKFKPLNFYSCFYIGKTFDIYVTYYIEKFYNKKQIKKFKKEKKYKYLSVLEKNKNIAAVKKK